MPTPQPGDPDFDWSQYGAFRAANPDPVAEAKKSLDHQTQQAVDYNVRPMPAPNSGVQGGLAARIKAAHPGAYDDIDDADLETRVLGKYPEYRDMATPAAAPAKESGWLGKIGSFAKDALPYVGAGAGALAYGAATGGTGYIPLGIAALMGGLGGAGWKHAIDSATGDNPLSTQDTGMRGVMKDIGETSAEGLKAGAIETATAVGAPYLGAGMVGLGRGQQAIANSVGSSLPGKIAAHAGIPGADILYSLLTHKSVGLEDVPRLAAEAMLLNPKSGRLVESLGGRMMRPAAAGAPDPENLPGIVSLKKLLGLEVEGAGPYSNSWAREWAQKYGPDSGKSHEVPYGMGRGVSGPYEETLPPIKPNMRPNSGPADDVWGGWPPEGPSGPSGPSGSWSPNPSPRGPAGSPPMTMDEGYAAELGKAMNAKPTPNAQAVMDRMNASNAFGSTADRSVGPMSTHTDADFLPESFKKLIKLDNQPTVPNVAEQGWKERLADIPRTRASDSHGFANGPGELHSVEGTQDTRTIDLINQLAEEFAGKGTRVTKVNKYPNPQGDDALRKAIRQRGYATGGLKRANR